MRRFIIWYVETGFGTTESFVLPQTPEKIVDIVSADLSTPTFFDGNQRFSIEVKPPPEGAQDPEDMPKNALERSSYIQVAGSSEAMTVEIRVPDATEGHIHYVVARHPINNPHAWVSIYQNNGDTEPEEARLHPEEVFTGEQAVPLFRDYIINNQLPSSNLLRQIDI